MSKNDWDQRHRAAPLGEPAAFLREQLSRLPAGTALDLACGVGANTLFLARHGWEVEAVDFSDIAIERLRAQATAANLPINARVEDLDTWSIPEGRYALIVCFNFLLRELFPRIVAALAHGGALVYETYTIEQASFGKPSNPDFLLQPGELRELLEGLRLEFYRETVLPGPRAVASALAFREL